MVKSTPHIEIALELQHAYDGVISVSVQKSPASNRC